MASSRHQTIRVMPIVPYLATTHFCLFLIVQGTVAYADRECTVICNYASDVRDADCSDTRLTRIPPAGLCSDALSVDFRHNKIEVVQGTVLEEYKQVQTMVFGFNVITELPTNTFGNLTNLRHLQVNNNNIRSIANKAFRELHKLTTLLLDNNVIEEIEPSAFDGLHALKKLYLIQNSMTVIPPGVFQDLKNMTLLNMNNNKISTLSGNPFAGLPRLEKLFLANNALTSVDMLGLKDLPLTELNFDNNNITTLHNIGAFLDKVTNSTSISLLNNPLHCDCKLEPFRHWLKMKESDNSPVMCATPAEVTGIILSDIGRNLCDEYNEPVEGLTSPKTTTPRQAYVGTGTGGFALSSDDTWKIVIIVCIGFLVIVVFIISVVCIGRRRGRDNQIDSRRKSPQNVHYSSVQIQSSGDRNRQRISSENSQTQLIGSAHQPAGSCDGYETYTIPPDAGGTEHHQHVNGYIQRNGRAPLVKQPSTGSVTTSLDIIIADSFAREDSQDRPGDRPVRFSISEQAIPEVELEFDSQGNCTNFGNKPITALPHRHPPPPPPQLSRPRHENTPIGTTTGYLPLPTLPQKV